MKGKRVLSLALAALMTLSLLVVPAAAVSFTDMTNHWAKDDVGTWPPRVVKGTSATTFAPDQKMTACEALLFCSRATGVDAIDKEAIAEDWEDELKEILPEEMYAWGLRRWPSAWRPASSRRPSCRPLSSAGGLVKSITRETLAMVRAMQLPLAQSLTSYPMSFADTTSIFPAALCIPAEHVRHRQGQRAQPAFCHRTPDLGRDGHHAPCGPSTLWTSGASMLSCPATPTTTGWAAPSPPCLPAAKRRYPADPDQRGQRHPQHLSARRRGDLRE